MAGWLAVGVCDQLFFLSLAHASGLNSWVQVSLAVHPKVSQQRPRQQPLRSLLSWTLGPGFQITGLRHSIHTIS